MSGYFSYSGERFCQLLVQERLPLQLTMVESLSSLREDDDEDDGRKGGFGSSGRFDLVTDDQPLVEKRR